MPLPPAKHDALFRLLVSDPGRAAALLRDHLPPEVAARLDPEHPPEHIEGTAIDGGGRATQTDAVFRVRMKDGASARIYVLVEHKSRPDARTPLQLMRYVLRLWTADMDSVRRPAGRLPLIIPVVFFHGRGPWTVPLSIAEMIDAPEGLGHLAHAVGAYTLRDLSGIAAEDLSSRADVRSALLALVLGIADSEFGRYILMYIAEKVSLPPERITAALRRVGADPEDMEALMGTAAQAWLEEGRIKGIEQGMAQGMAQGESRGKSETLARLLGRRFGPLSGSVRVRIAGADVEQLDRWLDAVLDAPTLDAVFGPSPKH